MLAAPYGHVPRRLWKIIVGDFYFNQPHLHKQSPKSGYGFLKNVVDAVISRAGPLIETLDSPHKHGGNPGYPAQNMLSAFVMRYALGERYANAFLVRLGSDERLLAICGLPCAPGERAFSDFKNKKLAEHKDMLVPIVVDVFLQCGIEIERVRELGLVPADKPPLGYSLTMDSTDIEAWARRGRTSRKTGEEIPCKDPDADWGYRTEKNRRSFKVSPNKRPRIKKDKGQNGELVEKDGKGETYLGYSANVISDSNHGLPLFAETRPASASDMIVLIPDLDAGMDLYQTISPRYFLGDKGYDSLKNIEHIISFGMVPIIKIRRPPKDPETGKRLHHGIYTADGRPTCIGGLPMDYVETDAEEGHLFRCPPEGCPLKEKVLFTGHCKDQHYEKPEGELLRIVGLLPRCSDEWKTEYKKRTGIERYNSSVKHSRLMNQHRNFNMIQMSLHVLMSTLTYLATALAHLMADDYAHMRHMRVKLPQENRQQRQPAPEVAPGVVAALLLHQLNELEKAA